MTSRERMLRVLHRAMPDRVPCVTDISNMVPCRLAGKPFWDIYLYQDPPLWQAFIAAVRQLGIDGFLDAFTISLPEEAPPGPPWTEVVIVRTDERIITRKMQEDGYGTRRWSDKIRIFSHDTPATTKPYTHLGLPAEPTEWEPVTGVKEWPTGPELLKLVKQEMGDLGVVGVHCGGTIVVGSPEDIYTWHDDPQSIYERRDRMLAAAEERFARLMALDVRPDFIGMGGSGTLVWQTPAMFRELGLPILKRMSALCREAGIPSHVHSCGPEKHLVQMAAEETDLVCIDPLEVPPMGDCNLRELKQRFGDKLVLKGNLHTTEVMLRGSRDDVLRAARQALDDAAAGGGFILATGDQCGRDTPLENFAAAIEACETWGRYE